MSRPDIINKLDRLLHGRMPFTEEWHVVYLLVEIRKVSDRDNNRKKYPLLRFYCDWCVHTDKDRITPEMQAIMTDIYADIFNELTNHLRVKKGSSKIVGFMYMEDLKIEVQTFLQEYGLMDSLVSDKENWIAFVSNLVNVLVDQPINNPTPDIRQFSFVPSAPGCVQGVVVFTNNIGNYSHYNFGNVF